MKPCCPSCGHAKPVGAARYRACQAAIRTKQRAALKGKPRGREPTEEELDTMIAEQMRNLPEWWKAEEAINGE